RERLPRVAGPVFPASASRWEYNSDSLRPEILAGQCTRQGQGQVLRVPLTPEVVWSIRNFSRKKGKTTQWKSYFDLSSLPSYVYQKIEKVLQR
ncbi:MAG: hypothetical protein AAGD96_27420, partial [Chloroflexota bacterium]